MKPTLIIVDDVSFLRQGLRRILGKEFDVVGEAEDGMEAVRLNSKHHPQLIVMDIVMPRLSGIEATRRIMSGPDPRPQIVVLSGMKEENVVLQALEAGACDYLFKPADPDKLRDVLLGLAQHAAA